MITCPRCGYIFNISKTPSAQSGGMYAYNEVLSGGALNNLYFAPDDIALGLTLGEDGKDIVLLKLLDYAKRKDQKSFIKIAEDLSSKSGRLKELFEGEFEYDNIVTSKQFKRLDADDFEHIQTRLLKFIPQIGGDALINKILNIDKIDKLDFDYKKLLNSPQYKKLKQADKDIIFNKIQATLAEKDHKRFKEIEREAVNLSYFICTNCKYDEKIPPGTKIFSKASENVSKLYSNRDYGDLIYDRTLARTRSYKCRNKECPSYKDVEKRTAVFIKDIETYRVRYVCVECKTSWIV